MAPDLTDDPDDARESSPEALLQVLSQHRQHSRHRRERDHGRGSRRRIAVVVGIAVAAALAAAGVLVWENVLHHTRAARTDSRVKVTRPVTVTQRHHTDSTPTPPARDKPNPPPPPKPIHVTLTAARSDSWVEVRLDSSTGRVLFTGVVPEGHSIHLAGRRLWARFGSLGNFDVTVNGHAVQPSLNGTIDTVITAAAIEPAP